MNLHKKKKLPFKLYGAILFFLVCGGFCVAEISSVSRQSSRAELENLQSALERSAVHCYATEGVYPESLDYIRQHYGITWNPDKYVVDYEIIGSNLKPTITVIPLQRQEG
ncbi:MAG: hypothetical protein PUF13_05595 [Lachnospiraceae bacterium]|nr:hypothetical protein [Lachnospiraceae bacterium]